MSESSSETRTSSLMRHLLLVSSAFAVGFLLGGNTDETKEVLTTTEIDEPLDMSTFPSESDFIDGSERELFDLLSFDNDAEIIHPMSPIMGDDGFLYDDDLVNLDDIIASLGSFENHTDDNEFLEIEDMIMEEEITEVPTDEEIDEPEAFADGIEEAVSLDYDRNLMAGHDFHTPLACNEGVENQVCTSFRTLIDSWNENDILVIPCGECIEVDYDDGSEITFPSGMSIEGKLYIPNTASITFRTKFVWVAGILEIETPDVGKQIKFSLYGEESQTFTAINPDSPLCSSTSGMGHCNLGSKVIAVVGGKLNIKGDADNCPAWEKLTDIGSPTPRPFENHLPCYGNSCWEDDTITLSGECRESRGHTNALGKYTVYCPIKSKGVIKVGESQGIKLTSIEEPIGEFTYPTNDGKELSLDIAGSCGKAGHTRHFNRCVIHCPLKKTAVIRHGSNEPLEFTSVANAIQMPPSTSGGQVELRLKSKCWNSVGHTRAYGRCAVMCRLFPTTKYNGGENSGKLKFTSKFDEDPVPFPVPTSKRGNGEKGKFILNGKCVYMQGHSNAWKGCVVRCPVERTHGDFGSFHAAARLNNLENGKFVDMKRILTYAHGGVHMYLLLQDFSKDQCSTAGADALNSVFEKGDEIVPSYQIASDSSADGNTFEVDRVLHYSYNRDIFLFLPSEKDKATCQDTADEFSDKFPPGYEVKVEPDSRAPGGETFYVDKVHHWAWNGNRIFFFPEKSDVGQCDQTVSEFNSKFGKNYGIEVSKRRGLSSLGQEVVASKGVHHWSWNGNGFFFFPDETDKEINQKFPVGYKLKVDFLEATDVYDIQVSSSAAECWKPGTELLLTSHTRWSKDQQVRRITSSSPETGILTLSEPIKKPITVADNEDFAVEVAQLNRRIVFEAEDDANDEHIGGHLIIHHTSSPQNIEGVEIRNFGQMGRLGRYPIHFHKCGDSPDSLVRKNVVRNSNQRCYVVHFSNKITLEDNVAHDAFGHCYFIEDGSETGNIFRRNLGSGIKRMPGERVVQLNEKSKRKETDGTSSVFWISNPQNSFFGNVAAGGEGHGFWFETHGSRRHGSLGAFEDNEVHSSQRFAFTTYSPGWRPNEVAVIKNLKAYRNPTWGAFLHVTQNLHFQDGLFADNGDKGVMISRGDDIVFDGTTFVGQTEFANKDCRREKVAIHLDPVRLQETVIWSFRGNKGGTIVRNSKFLNWSQEKTNCPSEIATPLKFFSHQTFIKAYSAPHVFEDLYFDDPTYTVKANMLGAGIDDVQIEVASDGNDILSTGGQSGFLINNKLESMVPTSCAEYNEELKFCPDVCLRTITILAGDSAFFDDIIMIVKDESGRQIQIEKNVRGHPGPQPVGNRFFSAYPVSLPKGRFQVRFEDSSGSLSWPKYAFVVPEKAPTSCSNYVEESDIEFVKPDPSRPTCDDLIFNGDYSLGKNGWYAFHHAIELQESGGIDGTAALASTMALNRGNIIAQSIDGSCLKYGDEYDVSLSYKIVGYNGSNNLPYVRLEVQNYLTSERLKTVSAKVFRTPSEFDPDGWNTISGVWTIDANIANADKHILHVGGGNHKVVIDNVSIRPRSQPSSEPSGAPSSKPSLRPSAAPSNVPTPTPTSTPSEAPTSVPSITPTSSSEAPTSSHSFMPTSSSEAPTSSSGVPTSSSEAPTSSSEAPTSSSEAPTSSSEAPSISPSLTPSAGSISVRRRVI